MTQYVPKLGMHDIEFEPISDTPIFTRSFWPIADADTDIYTSAF